MLKPKNSITDQPGNLIDNHLDKNLILINHLPLERNPAAVYLASLSLSGQRTQKTALDAKENDSPASSPLSKKIMAPIKV